MSGPKLSEYELEELRRAELERVQAALVKTRAEILQWQREAVEHARRCDRELLQVYRQLGMLSSSKLPPSQAAEARDAIEAYREGILALKNAWNAVEPASEVHLEVLPQAQAEEQRLRAQILALRREEALCFAGTREYGQALRHLREERKKSLSCSRSSPVRGMVPPPAAQAVPSAPRRDAALLQEELLQEIAQLLKREHLTSGMRERLDHVAALVEQESDAERLREIRSRTIKKFFRQLEAIGVLYPRYTQAYCKTAALRAALGEDLPVYEESMEDPESLRQAIDALEAEQEILGEKLLRKAERAEIEASIDQAMETLGYHLLGTRTRTEQGSVKLYGFPGGGAIHLTQRADGVVRMKIVELSDPMVAAGDLDGREPLVLQERFCQAYEGIVDAFGRHGVKQVEGTERRFPPDEQFVQRLDASAWLPSSYVRPGRAAASSRRTSIREPICLAGEA